MAAQVENGPGLVSGYEHELDAEVQENGSAVGWAHTRYLRTDLELGAGERIDPQVAAVRIGRNDFGVVPVGAGSGKYYEIDAAAARFHTDLLVAD